MDKDYKDEFRVLHDTLCIEKIEHLSYACEGGDIRDTYLRKETAYRFELDGIIHIFIFDPNNELISRIKFKIEN